MSNTEKTRKKFAHYGRKGGNHARNQSQAGHASAAARLRRMADEAVNKKEAAAFRRKAKEHERLANV